MPLDPDGHGDPKEQVPALGGPLPGDAPTEAVGVHQSDVVIRSAIMAGLADLRANPYLLDYCFASLPRDPLTRSEYGEQEVARAKEWFLGTNVRVFLSVNPNEVQFPCVTIQLQASAEVDAEGTLADVHYQPSEPRDAEWPVLFGPLDPLAYDFSAGRLTLDAGKVNLLLVEPGMVVVTRQGVEYPILDVGDYAVTVDSGAGPGDFAGMVIKAPRPAQSVELESAVYRETYVLGVHVDSEPTHLTYLHSVVMFVLLRYRQALLEARGFERASYSSTDLRRDDELLPEVLYSRYVTVTGTVRQVWPKAVVPSITSVVTIPSASG